MNRLFAWPRRRLARVRRAAGLLALGAAAMLAWAPPASASQHPPARLMEGLVQPPPDRPGTSTPPPDLARMIHMMRLDMWRHFERAEDPQTRLLSRQGARRTHWGYVLEHFRAMDRRRDGELSFTEVWSYVLAHIPNR